MSDNNSQNEIIPITIEQELQSSYLSYAMSVIISRAIPDVCDGLKPVHRRILYAMYNAGYTYNKPYRKAARVVGDVIGKYHPHGDTPVYEALVRMAQDFSLNVPLIDGQGNFGSIDGDPPAAMRYTESRLSKAAHKLLEDIDKDTVDFQDNYDGSESEPTILPAAMPNILINGTSGVAVGMATNIPPYNLGEVIDACKLLLENPDTTDEELMDVIQGPDFPTGGSIIGKHNIIQAFKTGRGIVTIRSKTHIEQIGSHKEAIIVTEVPYQVNKAKMIEKIADLVKEKKVDGITALRDESDKTGIRVVIELRKDVDSQIILNQLYSMTTLQVSFGINILVLNNNRPGVMPIPTVLKTFIAFRRSTVTRRTVYLLRKAREKSHLLIALCIATSNIDEMVRLIKSSASTADALRALLEKKWNAEAILPTLQILSEDYNLSQDKTYSLTEAQAKGILEMRLQKLTGLEQGKLIEDIKNLTIEINAHKKLLSCTESMTALIVKELMDIKHEFATPRKTVIEEGDPSCNNIEDLVAKEDMVVTITMNGYIKRVPLADYKSQNRGGKGKAVHNMKDEDAITQIFVTNTHASLLFFSDTGRVYKNRVYNLPAGTQNSRGRALVNILPLSVGEKVCNVMELPSVEDKEKNIIFITAAGNIRRNDLEDFRNMPSTGKIAIKLQEEDSLIGAMTCSNDSNIFIATKEGKSIKFNVNRIRIMRSRTSIGVRGINLSQKDRVVSGAVLSNIEMDMIDRAEYLKVPCSKRQKLKNADMDKIQSTIAQHSVNMSPEKLSDFINNEQFIITVTSRGFGKCTSSYEYRTTNRGGSGISNIVSTKKNGHVAESYPIKLNDDLMLITNMARLIRLNAGNIRITGRNTQGVILLKVNQAEEVVSVAKIAEDNSDVDLDAENDSTDTDNSNQE